MDHPAVLRDDGYSPPTRPGRREADTATRGWVAVVSASFVERYWPGQDPIGKTFRHLEQTGRSSVSSATSRCAGWKSNSEPQMYPPVSAGPRRLPRRLRPEGAGDPSLGSRLDTLTSADPPDRARRRSRAADLECAIDGRGAREATADADALNSTCGVLATLASCSPGRHLRPAGVHSRAAIAGDRRAPRARRGPVARGPDDLRRRHASDAHRHGAWRGGCVPSPRGA